MTTTPAEASRGGVYALLPRDWPQLIDEVIVDGSWSPIARAELLKKLVDVWVLAAVDYVDRAEAPLDHVAETCE